MSIINSTAEILDQLKVVTQQIQENDFVFPSEILNGSTLGQHVRHTLEFFICLQDSYELGVVNYDKRNRDKKIENSPIEATTTIEALKKFLVDTPANKKLVLEGSYTPDANSEVFSIDTNFFRELIYNIEHAIHHMALLKIGIRDVASYVSIPENFGVASSTVRYQSQVASAG